jgi:TfoX/Sxy family transcriptional regulator of competence genes
MSFNEKLADRLREALSGRSDVEEKKMFKGLTFMVDDKMCICVSGQELMCRIDPAKQEEALSRNGARPMIMKGKDYKGYLYVSEEGFRSKKDFDYWLKLCLEFNPKAKSSKKR